jgi:hypothetical protein
MNFITNLDVSANTELVDLVCQGNLISNLDVTSNISLRWLYCDDNFLTDIDVSKNLELRTLGCSGNQLGNIDLSANIALEALLCNNNLLSSLDLNRNPSLTILHCYNNKFSSLDFITDTNIGFLYCYNNQLLLSDLFMASEKINVWYHKRLGSQTLETHTLMIGNSIDYSSQLIFKGITTDFTIQKNETPAIINDDYTIDYGIITFLKNGNFTVTMTNDAIVSDPDYFAKVIENIEVLDGNNSISNLTKSCIDVFPNPTSDIVYITTDSTISEVKLYSTDGKLLQHILGTKIDISNYPNGLYFIQVDCQTFKVIKK